VDKTKIDSMEIPKNSNSRYLRGYVLVVFDSVSAANTAIEQLNKARFQGRRVIARPTREGAVVEQSGFSHETNTWCDPKLVETNISTTSSHERDEDRRRDDKPQRSKNREARSAGSEKKRTPEKKMPLPSKKTAGSQTDKKLPSKKPSSHREPNRKDEGPVIVDGTYHHQDKQ
jgi:RNA recognition motif-containing protein